MLSEIRLGSFRILFEEPFVVKMMGLGLLGPPRKRKGLGLLKTTGPWKGLRLLKTTGPWKGLGLLYFSSIPKHLK
jgi:hypothetical protein